MSRQEHVPGKADIDVLSWLFSGWLWAASLVLLVPVALVVGFTGAIGWGAPPLRTTIETLTVPLALLLVFLHARFIAFRLYQLRRDHVVREGTLRVTDDTSPGAVLTVASFSIIGLIASGIAFPLLYSTSGLPMLVAAVVAVLTVPVGYLLLVYLLGELIAGDRHRRRLRVAPATWHYLWTLPLLVLAWMILSGRAEIRIVIESYSLLQRFVSYRFVTVSQWDVLYVAIATPTALAFTYVVRRLFERIVRAIVP
jgi:hypothetical protein